MIFSQMKPEAEYEPRVGETVKTVGHALDRTLPENPYKVYVDVNATFSRDGVITPRRIRWTDGRVYHVERIVDVRRAASLRAGGFGLRYECRIDGQTTYLYYERDRWFVERRAD